tara:strand:- start:148 stop:1008 length:861 start_codon:yes stop_codon:yes gene_type:complete
MIENYLNIEKKCFQFFLLILFFLMSLVSCSMDNLFEDKVGFFPKKKVILKKIKSEKTIRSFRSLVSFEIFFPETNKRENFFYKEIGFEENSFSGNAFLVWQKPSSFRMEILSPFGNPYLSVLAKDKSLKIFHISKLKLYVGSLNRKTIENLFGIPIELDILIEILSVIKPKFGSGFYRFDKKKGILFPLKKALGNSKTFWISKTSLLTKKVEILLSGQKLYVRYNSYEKINGIYFPKSISIINPSTKAYIKIEIGESENLIFNSIQKNTFLMNAPSNTSIYHLSFD